MRRFSVTDVWRVAQAVGASILIAVAVWALVPIADPCDICEQMHPWWWCVLMGCW